MAGNTSDGNSIRVAIRFRPFNAREHAEGAAGEPALDIWENTVTLAGSGGDGSASRPGEARIAAKAFSFDHVFNCTETQEAVFDAVGTQLLENALNAYNGCIFAYGQTGSGKSHSMVGNLNLEEEKGVLPRACARLFQMLAAKREEVVGFQATVLASYLEIYNEKLFDLLSGGGREQAGELQIRLHPQLGAIVVNLTECPMESFQEALELFDFGAKRRAVGATQMNAVSSRSHAVFTLQIRTLVPAAGGSVESQAKIHFVDLAGSEKQKKSGATGARLKEGIGINQSLTTLGRVISDLTKSGNKGLPPFRDSKLTLLLKDALMGNSRTELLACVSPSRFNLDETVSTLEFAARCKLVKTSAKKNEQSRADVIAKLTAEKELIEGQLLREKTQGEELCKQLQAELERAQERQQAAERAVSEKMEIEGKLRQLEGQRSDMEETTQQQQKELLERERLLQEREEVLRSREREEVLNQAELEAQRAELERARALLREREPPGEGGGEGGCGALPLLGARVAVRLGAGRAAGTVRYAGPSAFSKGDVVGVALDEPRGTNNGTVQTVRYFCCNSGHGIIVPLDQVVPLEADGAEEALHERLAQIRRLEQQQETARESELRSRLEEERTSQQARQGELASQLEALKTVRESLALDQAQIHTRREALHRLREGELAKLGMHFSDLEGEDMANAPRLVNLHPDPALKGCLVYYLPIGETTIGASAELCQVKITGLSIGSRVCGVSNEDNQVLRVQSLDSGLVRVNGSLVDPRGQPLQDGDRLAVGRAHIFRVHIPRCRKDDEVAENAECEFEQAMGEIFAGAEVDPQWENGIQRAMLLVKSDFGTEAANKLLEQAKRASEAIALANVVLHEMPAAHRDGVAGYELSVMFDAHGLPEVCVVARREGAGAGRGPSAGIWELERFTSERLPLMHEALLTAGVEESCGPRHWDSRVWGELSVHDYRQLLEELRTAEQRPPERRRREPSGSGSGDSWGWLSGAAAQLKHNVRENVRAVKHAVKETTVAAAALKDDGLDALGHPEAQMPRVTSKSKSSAKGFVRSVSPAGLFRSMSAGRLEKPAKSGSLACSPLERTGLRDSWQVGDLLKLPLDRRRGAQTARAHDT